MQNGARNEAIANIKSLMAEYGLTPNDVAASRKSADTPSSKKTVAKVAAKFRNPATGQEWSGRGLKPRWLKAAIDSGKSLEEFAV